MDSQTDLSLVDIIENLTPSQIPILREIFSTKKETAAGIVLDIPKEYHTRGVSIIKGLFPHEHGEIVAGRRYVVDQIAYAEAQILFKSMYK